jgi:hypothetical protein
MSAAGGGGFDPRDEQTPKIPYNQSISADLFLLQAAGVAALVFAATRVVLRALATATTGSDEWCKRGA